MNQIDFKNHHVFSQIKEIDSKLAFLREENPRSPQYEEVHSKQEYLKWILDKSEKSLFSENDLSFLQSHLRNILENLPNSGSGFPNYRPVESWFSEIFGRFPYPRMRKIFRNETADKVREFISEVDHEFIVIRKSSETANQALVKLNDEMSELKARAADSSKELAEIRARIDAEVSNFGSRAETQTREKISEFEIRFSELQSSWKQETNELQAGGHTAISNLKSSLNESEKIAMSQFEAFKSEVDEDLTKFSATASATLDKIKEIYQISGETAMAGGFSHAASEESKLFFWYSTIAACLISGAAGYLIYSLQIGGGLASLEPLAVLSRIPITLLVLLPGAYFASIAGRARLSAMYLRSLSLRIAAFDAYLTNWPDQNQANAHREKMMSVFFDPDEGEQDKGAKQITIGSGGRALKILEKLLDRVTLDGK